MQRDTKDSSFSGPANYKIVVRGEVPESWKSPLAGMETTVVEVPGAARQTVLNGPIRDQAELSGVLQSLYTLHLTILDVKALDGH